LAIVEGELFTACADGVHCWDLESGQQQCELESADSDVTRLAVSSDGSLLAGLGQSKVLLWDVKTKKLVHSLESTSDLTALAFSPDGSSVAASGTETGALIVWDANTGETKHSVVLPGNWPAWQSMAFSSDGETILTGGADGQLCAFDWKKVDFQFTVKAQLGPVTCLAVSQDGKTIATGGGRAKTVWDHSIHLWDAQKGAELPHSKRPTYDLPSVLAVSSDGKRVVKGCFNKRFTVWDVPNNKLLKGLSLPNVYSRVTVALSPDGKLLATGGAGRIQLFDAKTGRSAGQLTGAVGAAGAASGMCFTPDGARLAVGTTAGWVNVWDVGPRRLKYQIKGAHEKEIWTLDCSPDGQSIATGSFDGAVAVWSTTTGQARFIEKAHQSLVRGVRFSADGMRLASAANDDQIIVWETATGKIVRAFDSGWAVSSVDFCQRGRVLVAGHYYDRLDLWDIGTGKKIETLRTRPGPYTSDVVVDPSGRRLWTAHSDAVVRQWDLAVLLEHVPALSNRSLTPAEAEQQWLMLADSDPAVANDAVWNLAAGGDAAMTLLRDKFAAELDEKKQHISDQEVRQLIRDLDDDRFQTRQDATERLYELGPLILPKLKTALSRATSSEVRFRLKNVIQQVNTVDPLTNLSKEDLRLARGIQILTYLRTPAALDLLQSIEQDDARRLSTRQARAALARLQKQSTDGG
jgi:WD40 repeat protein